MASTSDIDNDNKLSKKAQSLALFYLYNRYLDHNPIVTIDELEVRLRAYDLNVLRVNMANLFVNTGLVDITDSYDFRITEQGIGEIKRRLSEDRLY